MFGLRVLFSKVAAKQPLMMTRSAVVPSRMFSSFVNHRDTADNNEDTPFEFTKENYEKINDLL